MTGRPIYQCFTVPDVIDTSRTRPPVLDKDYLQEVDDFLIDQARLDRLEEWEDARRSFQRGLEVISRLASNDRQKRGATLFVDHAPLSFTFEAFGLHCGLIFHGPHDSFGSGGRAPTFSTCITPTTGWQVHE
jgi:hypothetical protein